MKFNSTRNPGLAVDLQDAIIQGLAPDGGLYMPVDDIDLRDSFIALDNGASFSDVATSLMSALFPDEFSHEECRQICSRAFPFSPVLRPIDDDIQILELYHGPSCAFKDFGASFLASIMDHYLEKEDRRAVILTATSGDTGSAVAQAFHGKDRIDVVILYPSGRVSPSQEMQLTTVGGNVHALEVRGTFDDCQRIVKEAFLDPGLRDRFPLTSANSISLGRLIPQSFYYAWAFAQIKGQQRPGELYFSVPSGNFGNLTAGVLAWDWGMPVSGFLACTNANDVVPEYLLHGRYQARPSVATLSNAMDVGNPSNFERLQAIFGQDINLMRSLINAEVVSDAQTLATMARYHRDHGIFVCPHTAVGLRGAERRRDEDLSGSGTIICLSTAHPGKFSEVVREACGEGPDIPERLAACMTRTKVATMVEPTKLALAAFLEERIKAR